MKSAPINKCCLCPYSVPPSEFRGKHRADDWLCKYEKGPHVIRNAQVISEQCKLPEWKDGN